MHQILTILFKTVIALSFLGLINANYKVTQVQVLFRHGERTPCLAEMYPNDIYGLEMYEPWGPGRLTNAGRIREYKLGQMLRTRYQELLGPVYNPNDVYGVSTDVDRTKMSLLLVLAGLFPPTPIETWNSEIPWLPIPINYVPEPLDILMKSHLCPEYQETVSNARRLPEIQAKVEAHSDFLDFVTDKVGRNVSSPELVYQIYNLLVAQKAMNLTLPEWCTDAVYAHLGEITSLEYQIRSHTTKLKRLLGGPLIRKFIENMCLDKPEGSPRKMYLYSGHEVTIASFVQAQKMPEPKLPLYGSAVMFEKLRDDNGKLFIRMVLWTGVTEKLITLRLPGCDEICPVERYVHLTRTVIPSDEEMDCHLRRLSRDQLRDIFTKEITYD